MKEQALFQEYYDTKNVDLRNKLVEEHLYMVDILIRKYLGKGIDYDDLYQVGAMALIKAVDRFDPSKGFEFASFATPTIIGEIKKYFRDKGWGVKVPRRVKEIATAIPSAKEELHNKLGRVPTVPELADFMDLTEREVLLGLEGSVAYSTYSINQTFDEAGEDGESPILEKYMATVEKGYCQIEDKEIIQCVLAELSSTNKFIFQKRFIENKSQAEVAKHLGVSQMTVSRAEKSIKEKFASELKKQ